jgi:hypothetical protein
VALEGAAGRRKCAATCSAEKPASASGVTPGDVWPWLTTIKSAPQRGSAGAGAHECSACISMEENDVGWPDAATSSQ